MAINPHIPKTVNAGEPVTAEAWNVIVQAILSLTEFVNSSEGSKLGIILQPAAAVPFARMTAQRDDGAMFEAVAPVPPADGFVFSGLKPGRYTIQASAPGFDTSTSTVVVQGRQEAPMAIELKPHGTFMPLVFGSTLPAALLVLQNAKINVSRILDVIGNDVPTANPGPDFNNSLVLAQIPDAGTPLAPGESVQIVIAAKLQVQPSIEVPSFAGLTLNEAQKALEALGLVLGKVTTKQKPPTGGGVGGVGIIAHPVS